MRRICSLRSHAKAIIPAQRASPSAPYLQRIAHWRGEDAAWLAATTDVMSKHCLGLRFRVCGTRYSSTVLNLFINKIKQ